MASKKTVLSAYRKTGSIRATAQDCGISYHAANKIIKGDQRRGKDVDGYAPESEGDLEERGRDAVLALRKNPMSLGDLSGHLGIGKSLTAVWIDHQRSRGVSIVGSGAGPYCVAADPYCRSRFDSPILEITSEKDDTFTFGAIGDSHLASKYERLDVLDAEYDRFAKAKVEYVFHTGNWVDGEASFNAYDLHVRGMDAQLEYLAEHYPRRFGITTYAIAGADHEGWWAKREGVDIGKYAESKMREAGRKDWSHIGYMGAYVRLVNRNSGESATMHVVHPGGGSAYAISWKPQKIVEGYAGGEKPAVVLIGHYHKLSIDNIRNTWAIQTGCAQDQTPFMNQKGIEPHVGSVLLRLVQDPRTGAIIECGAHMRRYFNVGYYNGRFSHSGKVRKGILTPGGVAA
jgi:hypothetical protein